MQRMNQKCFGKSKSVVGPGNGTLKPTEFMQHRIYMAPGDKTEQTHCTSFISLLSEIQVKHVAFAPSKVKHVAFTLQQSLQLQDRLLTPQPTGKAGTTLAPTARSQIPKQSGI